MRLYLWTDEKRVGDFARQVRHEAEQLFTLVDTCEQAELILVIGGDGAFLHAAACAAEHNTPIAGLPAGRLSFLYDTRRDAWRETLRTLAHGDYWLEERFLLHALHAGDAFIIINELVITRGRDVKPVHVKVWIDEEYLGEYHADGILTATPTGSTAYALSLGGPILPPTAEGILLTPIAPHLSLANAIVLPPHAVIRIQAASHGEVVLSSDGKPSITLHDDVLIRAAERKLQVARIAGKDYFFTRLRDVLRAQPVEEKLERYS